MNIIPCQCDQPKNGCPSCGGYGYVLSVTRCHKCFKPYWARPGVHTIYEGKRWRSFDGLKMVVHKGTSICLECFEKESK